MARQNEDDEVVVIEQRGSTVGPFLWGLAIGAVAALLLAPMSGPELRSEIQARGRRLRDYARDQADELEDYVSERYTRAREAVEDGVESARGRVREGRQFAQDVVDAGRSAAVTARDELERRLAEAREARRSGRSSGEEEPVA